MRIMTFAHLDGPIKMANYQFCKCSIDCMMKQLMGTAQRREWAHLFPPCPAHYVLKAF